MEFTEEQKVYQTIINEAWQNESFKKELIEKPVETIEKLTGKKVSIPEGKTLVVKDQTDESTLFINIPTEQKIEDMQLTEEELEHIAGGGLPPFISSPFPGGQITFK